MATLVGDVAAAWDAHWIAQAAAEVPGPQSDVPQSDVPQGDTRRFLVALGYVPGGGELSELTLTLDAAETASGPEGWPTAYVRGPDAEFVQLHRTSVSDRESRYTPATPVPVTGPRVVRLEWPGLNVAAVGNALASVSARRNAHLIQGMATNLAFVLSTAIVTAPDIATPLLTWTAELPLSGASLGPALSAALQDLFGDASGAPVTLGLTYGHQLVAPPDADSPGLNSYLPAALYPAQPLSPALGTVLAQTAAAWQAANRPAREGGEWVVSLTLSSWLDPASSRPLLVIDRLVLPL